MGSPEWIHLLIVTTFILPYSYISVLNMLKVTLINKPTSKPNKPAALPFILPQEVVTWMTAECVIFLFLTACTTLQFFLNLCPYFSELKLALSQNCFILKLGLHWQIRHCCCFCTWKWLNSKGAFQLSVDVFLLFFLNLQLVLMPHFVPLTFIALFVKTSKLSTWDLSFKANFLL